MDAALGELSTTEGLAGKVFCAFRLLEATDAGPRRGEVTLPAALTSRTLQGAQLRVQIPYTPLYEELCVRLRYDSGNGHTEYAVNPTANTPWFTVYRQAGEELIPVRLSQLESIDAGGRFLLVVCGGVLSLYSACETDLRFSKAKYQNEVFLLKAFPGSLYQYPTTGVGLIDFLHGNFENTGLAARLQAEFEADGMTIINASMDSATGELLLETVEKEDADG